MMMWMELHDFLAWSETGGGDGCAGGAGVLPRGISRGGEVSP